jgi:protein-S-isoprenylcysteine O-methyltransferase Ste14
LINRERTRIRKGSIPTGITCFPVRGENVDLFILAAAVIWIVFWVYWISVAVMNRSPTKRQQSAWSGILFRLFIMFVVVSAFVSFSSSPAGPGFLVTRVIPDTLITGLGGTIITLAGIGFAIRARLYLGKNWSSMPAIKVGHELIRNGPYRYVRHPIYTGILCGLAGTIILIGEPIAVIGLLLILLAFLWKIRMEEQYLLEEFGNAYARYKSEVHALIPFLL